MISVSVAPHPSLELGGFVTEFPRPLGEVASGDALRSLISSLEAPAAPLRSDDGVRSAVRDLLRHGGYKPTGRGKPASEYLLRAVGDGSLGSINPAVDACNAVSLHSGLPISVVDLDLARPPLSVRIAGPGSRYQFNAAGQEIDVSGLLCLCDDAGPCANAVKDAQRTKTHPGTRRTLSLVWGVRSLGDRTSRATAWYRELLAGVGATTESVTLEQNAVG